VVAVEVDVAVAAAVVAEVVEVAVVAVVAEVTVVAEVAVVPEVTVLAAVTGVVSHARDVTYGRWVELCGGRRLARRRHEQTGRTDGGGHHGQHCSLKCHELNLLVDEVLAELDL
jgi:hypothetical protein